MTKPKRARCRAMKLLAHAAECPFDSSDEGTFLAAVDWAHAAARGVVMELRGRQGIKFGFDEIDEETRREIIEEMAEIIRAAHEKAGISAGGRRK